MYDEVNTKNVTCLHRSISKQLKVWNINSFCVAKGGGSANKTYLYQETKAILNPETLVPFLVEKMKTLGTAACPPYHIAFVIGGTSAEKNLLTVKLASTHYYDNLPTSGNEYGRAFRDVELEKKKFWKRLITLVWVLSSVVNIMHTTYVSFVCRATVLPVR